MEKRLQSLQRENNLACWAQRIEECSSGGLTVRQWCSENGIAPNTYYWWQKRVYEAVRAEQEQFYEVPIARPSGGIAVSIEMNGVTADVRHGADEETIIAVLRAIKLC